MKLDMKTNDRKSTSLRYAMLVPMLFMIGSVISCCLSYSNARQNISEDLNEAILAFANENRELWTRQDTIAALRKIYEANNSPIIYQASDLNFRNPSLKEIAYFTIALIDRKNVAPRIQGNRIASDSVMLVPEMSVDGVAIQVQGFADCSMASLFAVSDHTLPGVLISLSVLSMASIFVWRRKENVEPKLELAPLSTSVLSLNDIKLTPMQRKFAQTLLDAPDMKVDKATLCDILWGNKDNAEESLYTLVRRTKTALSSSNFEIICNRGESYELRINR